MVTQPRRSRWDFTWILPSILSRPASSATPQESESYSGPLLLKKFPPPAADTISLQQGRNTLSIIYNFIYIINLNKTLLANCSIKKPPLINKLVRSTTLHFFGGPRVRCGVVALFLLFGFWGRVPELFLLLRALLQTFASIYAPLFKQKSQ
jgi:hypothetical protein